MDDIFEKPHRHHIQEIPLAPILDMMVAVIFFLVLSTTFVEYTKLTLPPSGVTTITDPIAPPPLAPKLFATREAGGLHLMIRWAGPEPGQLEDHFEQKNNSRHTDLALAVSKIVNDFKTKFPKEKSLQLGLGRELSYQDMVSIMDGIQEHIADVILISYNDAEAVGGLSAKQTK